MKWSGEEGLMLQKMNHEMDFADVLQWAQLVCDAPSSRGWGAEGEGEGQHAEVVNSNTSHTACTDAHTLSAHHIALIPCTTSKAPRLTWLCAQNNRFQFISLARCLLLHTEHPALHPLFFPLFQVSKGWLTSRIPCADPREPRVTGYTESRTSHRFWAQQDRRQPDHLMNKRILPALKTIRITEIEGHVKTLSCNQSMLFSTRDSIASIAMPLEADLDDEQIRALLASPRADQGLMSSSSQGWTSQAKGGRVALFSHQRRFRHHTLSEREREHPVVVLGSDESIFRNSNPANVATSLLDGNRDHLLTQNKIRVAEAGAKSGIS